MKKIIILITLVVSIFASIELKDVSANHLAYQKMDIYGGKLLQDYTSSELKEASKKVDNRQFASWNVHYMAQGVKVYFTSHTIFSYYNTGTSAIDYTYTSTVTTTKKVSFAASGTIKFNATGSKAGFKGGLDTSLKLDYDTSDQVVEKEEIKMSFKCDPNTRVLMYVAGEGRLYNGVARKYFFWFETEYGGFEYFISATEYQVLEKVAL